ncbi:MAG TPA: heavy metal translocating P-type ATPase [Sulfuriferula sp.]|nr:heavy metal translocating P-type ATPase [Sulfuriferula sp.]
MSVSESCYHCGQPVPGGVGLSVNIAHQSRAMCCLGCQAVAQAIVDNGLSEYYKNRTALPGQGHEVLPDELKKLALYDHPDIQRSFVIDSDEHLREAVLILEGITCAACVWLNERHLKQLPGVKSVQVNYASHRARVAWDSREITLSRILQEIQLLGYNAHPYSALQADALRKSRRKKDLQRIAIAGIGSAQAMMLSVGLYAGNWYGIDPDTVILLRWFGLLLTLPVVTFSAMPFYRAAWSGIKSGHLNMDVPVALAIITAFIGSVWVTLFGGAHVYYDSIGMFTLFLLGTRLLEAGARGKSVESAENLLKLQPTMAIRLRAGQQEYVPVLDLVGGDCILCKPGETVAADGMVVEGVSTVDEALLTGESRPVVKQPGDSVIAGSVNLESPLTLTVTGVGENTVLAGIVRLVDKAQAEKPRIAGLADRAASWFTVGLLIFTALVGLVWFFVDRSQVLDIVLAVLVVTCPCALSLAIPAALAAAGSHLIKRGILVTRGHALETLARVNHVVFDKTGTLTQGKPVVVDVITLADVPAAQCDVLAASLEQASEHPLAAAFKGRVAASGLLAVQMARNHPGQGVSGETGGQCYTLGNQAFSSASHDVAVEDYARRYPSATLVWLCDATRPLAVFVLEDPLRGDAVQAVATLKARGIEVSILSGDNETTVRHVGNALGVRNLHWQQKPQDKLASLQAIQRTGAIVAMVGDGINDAPVLAGAQVSFAMAAGTNVANQSSDIVLLSNRLGDVPQALETGHATLSVMQQNLFWAVAYNLIALPFASLGYVSPWLAALGMSISSMVVVLNALRLR